MHMHMHTHVVHARGRVHTRKELKRFDRIEGLADVVLWVSVAFFRAGISVGLMLIKFFLQFPIKIKIKIQKNLILMCRSLNLTRPAMYLL